MCEPGPTLTVNTAVDSGDMRYKAALGVGSAVSMSQYSTYNTDCMQLVQLTQHIAPTPQHLTTRVSNYRPILCAHSLSQPFTGL